MVIKTLAHYEIEGVLGQGGSGVVYRGRDLRLERDVAIKVLADALRDDEMAWARLLREARLASQLNHPNIATVYDLGEEEGSAFIAMEYVEGLALADVIPEGGIRGEQFGRYAAQIGSALDFAHSHGVIHGDLKGTNILVTPEGSIKLLDFGLGRRIPRSGLAEVTSSCIPLAEAGATAGTLPYLAPEVLRGGPTSPQSDVWALGVLLYQMATGELPFRGGTPFEVSVEIMVGSPARLEQVPERLQSTLRTCLEKDPSARSTEVARLTNGLVGLPSDIQFAAPFAPAAGPTNIPTLAAAPLPRWARRKWWVVTAGMAVLVLVGAALYAQYLGALRQVLPPSPQVQVRQESGVPNPAARVWVNTDSGAYHCQGTRWYGRTHAGEFMTQQQAQDKGFHPAGNRACM